jgi:hypothetical protein
MAMSLSEIKTLQFEAVKMALKQDKNGYVLTLSMHPDEIPEDLMRDFVGSRYQVVMVRINSDEQPMDRDREFEGDKAVRLAGLLCRDKEFWEFLHTENQIFDPDEKEATEWLRTYCNVTSRSELKTNPEARKLLDKVHREYQTWKNAS